MRLLKLMIPVVALCLFAAACSSDGDDSAPPVAATEVPTEAPTMAPQGLTAAQQELSDSVVTALLEDDERPSVIDEDQVRCLADGLAAVFSDERLGALGMNGASVATAYESSGSFSLADDFGVSDDEAAATVDVALECLDWRAFMAAAIAADGVPLEQANCIASEISSEGIRAVAMSALITELEDDFGLSEAEVQEAFQSCVDAREMLFNLFVAEDGLSEQSARCIADGIPDEVLDIMLSGQEPDEEEALEMMGELFALQNRCLTPEELDVMGGSGFDIPDPSGGTGSGTCPPSDGSGPTVLYFDGPQPMCLDASKQYTAVFDTTAGEMRIALDMANTPVTANNFAVLAQNHYYDDTLLFRTDPSIGIIQGGAPHTNSPSDPGPGYTIPDEGSGFTYEPGQIVMARTAAPNSASAQFFFAVNENTARLNNQGTYVVFGQMDDASLAVAEAILASHVDQPDNPLGGGPEPPVFVNSVTIEESG